MFKIGFSREFEAKNNDLVIKLNASTTEDFIKITNGDSAQDLLVSRDIVKGDNKV